MGIIEVNGLTRHFGNTRAVDNLSFSVDEGEVFGMLGPNGAGKTTTIRILACLILPSDGSVSVLGRDALKYPQKVRATVGVLTENPSLYERLTVNENLDFFAEAYGILNRQRRRERIRQMLEFFNLGNRKNDRVGTLSKGMKQKLSIARAIIHDPPVMLLDEPTAGLDPAAAKEIRDMVSQLSLNNKHTVLLCTHHLEDAQRLCGRVMIMNKGKKVVVETPRGLSSLMVEKPVIEVRLMEINGQVVKAVQRLDSVVSVESDDAKKRLIVTTNGNEDNIPLIVEKIVYAGGRVVAVKSPRPSLEEAYLKLIKESEAA